MPDPRKPREGSDQRFDRAFAIFKDGLDEFMNDLMIKKSGRGFLTDEEITALDEVSEKLDELEEHLAALRNPGGPEWQRMWGEKEKIIRDSLNRLLAPLDPSSPETQRLRRGNERILAHIQRYKQFKPLALPADENDD